MNHRIHALALLALLASCGGGSSGGGGAQIGPGASPPEPSPSAWMTILDRDGLVRRWIADGETGALYVDTQFPRFFFVVARDLLLTEEGERMYVLDGATSMVERFAVDPATGATVKSGGTQTLAGPRSLTLHPSETFLFVQATTEVQSFRIEAATGDLVDAGTAPLALSPTQSLVDPTGARLYVLHDFPTTSVSAFAIAPTTGALTPIDLDATQAGVQPLELANEVSRLAFSPDGSVLYQARRTGLTAYRVGAGTGSLTMLADASSGVSNNVTDAVVAGDASSVYAVHAGGELVTYAVDPDTGALERIDADDVLGGTQNVDLGVSARKMAFGPSWRHLYVADPLNGSMLSVELDGDGRYADQVRYPMRKTFSGLATICVGQRERGALKAPRNLYLGMGASAISRYSVEADGSLTHQDVVATTAGAAQLLTDPAGRFLYAVNSQVEQFAVDPATGVLTSLGLQVESSDPQLVRRAAPHVSGFHFFAATVPALSGGFNVYNSGIMSTLEPYGNWNQAIFGGVPDPSPFSIGDVAAHPTGEFAYYARAVTLRGYTFGSQASVTGTIDFDPGTAGVQDVPSINSVRRVVVDPTGRTLLTLEQEAGLFDAPRHVVSYAIDSQTGRLTHVPYLPPGTPNAPAGALGDQVVFDPTGRFVFVANDRDDEILLYRHDPEQSRLSANGVLPLSGDPAGIACDPSGRFLYVAAAGELLAYEIDPTTGALTDLGLQDMPLGTGPILVSGGWE